MRSALLVALLLGVFGLGRASADDVWKDQVERYIDLRYPAGHIHQQDRTIPLVIEFEAPKTTDKTYRLDWAQPGPLLPEEWRFLRVPPGETRAISMVIPPNRTSSLYGLSVDGRSLSLGMTSSGNHLVMGVLAPDKDRFDYLRSLAIQKEINYSQNYGEEPERKLVPLANITRLEAELIPQNWGSLENLDVIVVYDWNLLGLTHRQTRALLDWAAWRGHLVLISNGLAEEFKNSLLEPYLPFRTSSVRTSGELVQLVGQPKEEAEILAEFDGLPLAVSKPHMQGRITLITAPLTRLEPLAQDSAEELWGAIVERIYPPDPIVVQGSSGYLITDMPELPRVQAGYVVLVILFYALVVGPVNLTYLRKRDKMLRSFITVPIIAVVFAGSIYLLSLVNRSTVPVLREIGAVHFQNGSTEGLAGSELVLFSPYQTQYRLDTGPSTIIGEFSYRTQRKPMSVLQPNSRGGLSSTVSLTTWDLLATEARSLRSIDEPVRMGLDGDTLTVESPWETELNQACFWHAEKGVSAPFTLHRGENRIELDFAGDQSSGSSGRTLDHPEWELRTRPGRERLVTYSTSSPILYQDGSLTGRLLLWTDQLPTEVTIEPPATVRSDTLVVYDLREAASAGDTP